MEVKRLQRTSTSISAERVRAGGFAFVVILTLGWMSYMAHAVPVRIHVLPGRFLPGMTAVAIGAFIVMLSIDAIVLFAMLQHRRLEGDTLAEGGERRATPSASFLPQQVGLATFGVTALASTVVFFGLGLIGIPLWFMAGAALVPWLPLYVSTATWQYRHYGAFALFGTLVLLQLGHLSEHIVQNLQLLATHGRLSASRGVFGQLDVETVHFYWNIGIWLGTGALLYRYGFRNVWLTLAFIAASLHSVEHLYLYWLYVTHSPAYLLGGWNGILGEGGLIGSPLARPYLHLVYNVVEVGPFVLAYYEESTVVFAGKPTRATTRPAVQTG